MAEPIEILPEREQEELQRYLGPGYRHDRLQRHRQELASEVDEVGDERAFYRTSNAYLYDLTAFAMSGAKLPYLRRLAEQLPRSATLLDYGCGIGSDGLVLLEAGFRVSFADFDNPSTRYLRWRLAQRGLDAPVYDLDRDAVPGGFDAAYAFDVIEHVDDPDAFLEEIESRARLVAVNLLEDDPGETAPHRVLPIGSLISRAATGRLRHYRRYHGGRSHLLIYSPERAAPREALSSRAELWRGRAAHLSSSLRRAARRGLARISPAR